MKIIVNGTFDVLHLGHIRLLEYAKYHISLDAFVYVLIDSDRRIKELKGPDRPIHCEYERFTMLRSLRVVDKVDVFDTDDELRNYIKNYEPDVMVKGSDYQGKPIIGAEHCKEIKFYGRLEKYSTTQTIQRIIDRR
jgi:D-beta-D-heptose 7-phosphate kinase/D-beta-D-heptose 1-phosphate adenosyltransferase